MRRFGMTNSGVRAIERTASDFQLGSRVPTLDIANRQIVAINRLVKTAAAQSRTKFLMSSKKLMKGVNYVPRPGAPGNADSSGC
jgi:hypothetical protein